MNPASSPSRGRGEGFVETYILAASCVFPAGPNMVLAHCAWETGLTQFHRHPVYLDQSGQAVQVSSFSGMPFTAERWCALLEGALKDMLDHLGDQAAQLCQGKPCPLWLILPDHSRPGVPSDIDVCLAQMIANRFPMLQLQGSLAAGHTAAAHAIQLAHARKALPLAIAAVDSWLHPDSLRWLEMRDFIHNAGRPYKAQSHRNPYGRVPGEGAAALLLSGEGPGWCRIAGLGTAEESVLANDSRPCIGQGLTLAAQQALAGLPSGQRVGCIVSDLNGEMYRADQFGFTTLRIAEHLAEGWQQLSPALVSGDLGATTALAHLALSAYALAHHLDNPPHGPRLVLSSADDTWRAAALLLPASSSTLTTRHA